MLVLAYPMLCETAPKMSGMADSTCWMRHGVKTNCKPGKQPGFHWRRGGKEANTQQCVRSLRTYIDCPDPPYQIIRADGPSRHASKWVANIAASREIVPFRLRGAGLPRCQKCVRKQKATMVRTSHAREEHGEKSDPWVRFLVMQCVPTNEASCRWSLFAYTKNRLSALD